MICANCAQQVAAGALRCPACNSDPLLDGRYRLDRLLARDTLGASHTATRIEDGVLTRAHSCEVNPVPDTVPDPGQRCDHPGLPRWIDDFTVGPTRWEIHAQVRGRTLAELLAAAPGRRLDAGLILAMVTQLADALAYLEAADRSSYLVQATALTPSTIRLRDRSATWVFELGHASDSSAQWATEQTQLGATAATRVWALGMVAVTALSGASPETLGDADQRLRWRDHVDIDERFAAVLEGMLESEPARRISAAAVAQALAPMLKPSIKSLQPIEQPRLEHRHAPLVRRPKPLAPRPKPRQANKRPTSPSNPDVPVMRPEELSRELSQANLAIVALEQQQRTHVAVARVLVVLTAAGIAALGTYLALAL